jgi:PAS domain S-box-containing protein
MMSFKSKYSDDERVNKIMQLLVKYNTFNFSARESISEKGDEMDAIITALNTLGEELQASGKIIREYEGRVNMLLETLLRYTLMDFSVKAQVSGSGDEVDAIAVGLNTLGEELEAARIQENKFTEELKKNEQRFSRIFTLNPLPLLVSDIESGKIAQVNDAGEKFFGTGREEIIGKNKIELGLHLTAEQKELLNRIKHDDSRIKSLEVELANAKGEIKEAILSVDKILLGNRESLLLAFSDITERKRAEEEMLRVNQFLDTILENIPNMIFVKDAKELRFLRFNKAGEKLVGMSRDQLIGKNDFDFFPKDQAEAFTGKDKEVLKGDEVIDIPEEPIQTTNGERWLHTKKIPIKDKSGNPAYLLGISEDITERKKTEEKIIRLNHELERNLAELEIANKELEAFSYSVSHDLRAPLRAIHGYTKIISEDYLATADEEAKEMMLAVMHNAKKMGQLIDDLLSFSRIGKKDLQLSTVNMNELVQTILNELKSSMPHPGATISVLDLPPAKGDSTLIGQVLTNLISNAIKYSSKKENPQIEIGSKVIDNEPAYYVKDNGVGFDMKYYDKLFGVFQRLHSMTEFEGTGVGLALVKRIVNRHGGKVWGESKQGEGTTFYFTLDHEIKSEQAK